MLNESEDKTFLVCEKCGKKLIKRMPNGILYFIFGRRKDRLGVYRDYCPVELYIHGSIKIKCLSRDCDHFTIINFFPNVVKTNEEEKSENTEETCSNCKLE